MKRVEFIEYRYLSVDDLRNILIEKGINFSPYSQNDINKVKEKLGGMPKLLEEYYLKIGWFSDISDKGCGCYIYSLNNIYVMTAQDIHNNYETENEVDDYLVFGREAVSVDEFAVKVKDSNDDNPILYIFGDSTYEDACEAGLLFGTLEVEPYLSCMFSIINMSL